MSRCFGTRTLIERAVWELFSSRRLDSVNSNEDDVGVRNRLYRSEGNRVSHLQVSLAVAIYFRKLHL